MPRARRVRHSDASMVLGSRVPNRETEDGACLKVPMLDRCSTSCLDGPLIMNCACVAVCLLGLCFCRSRCYARSGPARSNVEH